MKDTIGGPDAHPTMPPSALDCIRMAPLVSVAHHSPICPLETHFKRVDDRPSNPSTTEQPDEPSYTSGVIRRAGRVGRRSAVICVLLAPMMQQPASLPNPGG